MSPEKLHSPIPHVFHFGHLQRGFDGREDGSTEDQEEAVEGLSKHGTTSNNNPIKLRSTNWKSAANKLCGLSVDVPSTASSGNCSSSCWWHCSCLELPMAVRPSVIRQKWHRSNNNDNKANDNKKRTNH